MPPIYGDFGDSLLLVYHITAKSLNIAHCHGVSPYSLDKPNCVTFATVAVPREQFVGRGYPAKRCSSRYTKISWGNSGFSPPRGEQKKHSNGMPQNFYSPCGKSGVDSSRGSFLDNLDECAADTGYIWAASIMCLDRVENVDQDVLSEGISARVEVLIHDNMWHLRVVEDYIYNIEVHEFQQWNLRFINPSCQFPHESCESSVRWCQLDFVQHAWHPRGRMTRAV